MKSITLIIEMYLCLFIIVVFAITINMYAIIRNQLFIHINIKIIKLCSHAI